MDEDMVAATVAFVPGQVGRGGIEGDESAILRDERSMAVSIAMAIVRVDRDAPCRSAHAVMKVDLMQAVLASVFIQVGGC